MAGFDPFVWLVVGAMSAFLVVLAGVTWLARGR
jgi:heme exporter protein D